LKPKFTYVGIRVKSMKRSIEFYTKFLGMKHVDSSRIEATKGDVAYLVSDKEGVGIELNHYDGDSPFNTKYVVGEGLDHLAFAVDDLDAWVRRARRLGYKYLREVKTDKSRWVYVQDPNGIWIELLRASQ
jgi:lactoylglutathione lyase